MLFWQDLYRQNAKAALTYMGQDIGIHFEKKSFINKQKYLLI